MYLIFLEQLPFHSYLNRKLFEHHLMLFELYLLQFDTPFVFELIYQQYFDYP